MTQDLSISAMTLLRRRSAASGGRPIALPLLRKLERRLGVDLGEIRVHDDDAAAEQARMIGADAFTCGTDIAFAPGRYRPETREGLRLLLHEIVHVLQQRSGRLGPSDGGGIFLGHAGDRWEREADEIADRLVSGMRVDVGALRRPARSPHDDGATRWAMQRHDSFEHRALGDMSTTDLTAISAGDRRRTEIINREIDLMWLWHQEPEQVTEEDVHKLCPWVRTLRLPASGLLVTYGELNALPDYIATAGTADTISKEVLLPILQFVRQESYIQLNKLLDRTVTDAFADAVYRPQHWAPGLVNTLLSTRALDALTAHLGIDGVDHYQGLLARNACHFAPFSWHRWQSSYIIARDLAARAHAARDPDTKAQLTHQAWIQHGYGDHFLQDSFAAGHLVNKTLIMQWFVEWAATQSLVPVLDWEAVRTMTTTRQPGLAGRTLYDPSYTGPSNDPQTAEERESFMARLQATGLVARSDTDYQNYLAFLSSVITQSASAAIHDHYNDHSLWVSSPAHPEAYEVWGDDTLLSGAGGRTGAQQTSHAAHLSQQSIAELLAGGTTSISVQQVRDLFPTRVRGDGRQMLTLEEWNDTQQQFCGRTIFPALHDVVLRMSNPLIPNVSRDQDLTQRWCTSLPGSRYTTTSVLDHEGRLYAGSNGYVYELDPDTGTVIRSLLLASSVGAGDYDPCVVADGGMLFVGMHGYVYGIDLADWSRPAWTTSLPQARYTLVDLLVADGHLYAASNGHLYDLTSSNGRIAAALQLGSSWGVGDYTMRLALDAETLVVGCHGYVYGVSTTDFRSPAWACSLPGAGYHRVEVLTRHGRLFAGSSGRVFELDPAAGRTVRQLLLSSELGVGDYTTTLAITDDGLLAGTHGYVYGVRMDDWSRPSWWADLEGNRYSMVNVLATGDDVIAGSYGYVYRIDPGDGRVLRRTLLTLPVGAGEYETRLARSCTGHHFYAGVHGYASRLSSELRH